MTRFHALAQPLQLILTCIALPVFPEIPVDNVTVAEGSDVVLRCEATGEGTLNYQWRRLSGSLPDNVQGNNTTNLTITNITVSDGGEYYCLVDNGGTGVSSSRLFVIVKSKQFYTLYIHIVIVILYMHYRATYNC